MERNEEKDKIIQNFYEDPLTTGNIKVLFDNIQKNGIKGIDRKYVEKWLNLQPYKQFSKKYKQSGYYIPVKPRQEFQLDILYFIEPNSSLKQYQKYDAIGTKTFILNKGYKYGLVCIDIFTKYAQVRLLKKRTAVDTLEATLDIFKVMGKPESIYTDEGSEFASVFLKKMNKLGVKPITTMTHASFAERFIKTLKTRLYAYMYRVNTKTFYNIVDKIVENYNNSYHSVIKMTPKEATNPKNEKNVRQNINKTYLNKKKRLRKREDFKVGDTVRYLIKRSIFSKDYEPSYSKEIAKIEKFGDTYIRLDNGRDYLKNELLKVEKPLETKSVNKYKEGTLENQLREMGRRRKDIVKTALNKKKELVEQRKSGRKSKHTVRPNMLSW